MREGLLRRAILCAVVLVAACASTSRVDNGGDPGGKGDDPNGGGSDLSTGDDAASSGDDLSSSPGDGGGGSYDALGETDSGLCLPGQTCTSCANRIPVN